MRIGQVSAAIGLSATVFAGSLVCAPLNAAASDFSNYLAQGYSQLAKAAGKAPVSQLYKKRSAAAAGGQAVEPLGPDASHLDVLAANEARNYRDQLIEGLQAGGRERQPLLAAIAQVNYDCWVMPLPKRKGAPRSAECHKRFLQAFQGLPDKHHRGPISSVEPWQLAAMASGPAPAPRSGDSIGALILSLSAPSALQRSAAYDAALASVYAVGGQSPDGLVMGNCDANCLAMSFSGPGTAPLIAALIDDRDRNFRGPGDSSAGQQSASAGSTNGAPGTGNNRSANNGQSSNSQGTSTSGGSVSGDGSGSGSTGSGSASGGPGSGAPGTGPPGGSGSADSGDGGNSSDGGDGGPGNGGGHGHGHGHGHNGGG